MLDAWERFVGGDDHVRGVRPEVVISWHRCREKYRVDPHLTEAPAAPAEVDHSLEHDVIFTELGGLAMSAAREGGGPERHRHRDRRGRAHPRRVG